MCPKAAPSVSWVAWHEQRHVWAGLLLPSRGAQVLSSQSPVPAGPQGLPVSILSPTKHGWYPCSAHVHPSYYHCAKKWHLETHHEPSAVWVLWLELETLGPSHLQHLGSTQLNCGHSPTLRSCTNIFSVLFLPFFLLFKCFNRAVLSSAMFLCVFRAAQRGPGWCIIDGALWVTLRLRKVRAPGRWAPLCKSCFAVICPNSQPELAMAKNNLLRNCFFPPLLSCSQAQAVPIDPLHLLKMFCKRHLVKFIPGVCQWFLLPEPHMGHRQVKV